MGKKSFGHQGWSRVLWYNPGLHWLLQCNESVVGDSEVRQVSREGLLGIHRHKSTPDRQCCLSTEEEWPSLLGAAVRTWCSFHGLSHQELQELRLQDYFVVKLLRYKKISVWDLYYQRTNAAHQSFDFSQPPPMLSFLCLPYATTVPSMYGVWVSFGWGGKGMTRTKEVSAVGITDDVRLRMKAD